MAIATLLLGAASLPAQHPGHHPSDHGHKASESAKVAGAWQFSMETPHGKMAGVFKIQQDGSKLSGVCEMENGQHNPLAGSIEGKKVALRISTDHMDFQFKGTVDGAKMTGTTEPHGATWAASRKEK
ncbi:MAG: hypothetical protein HY820_38130 [Acidobacteria bacterium]|nr:hypothetical protein [Acidobacteriota bacterium]